MFLFLLIPEVTLPERSFIRASYDKNKDHFASVCEESLQMALLGQISTREAAERIGNAGVSMIVEYIHSGMLKAKSSITLSSSPQKTTPLIDSGQLISAITYWIEENAE